MVDLKKPIGRPISYIEFVVRKYAMRKPKEKVYPPETYTRASLAN